MNDDIVIEVRGLVKKYEKVTPINGLDAIVRKGDVIAIIGPSGTGKSTFLRCLNRLETPTAGEIFFHGKDITKPGADLCMVRTRMGMVFQSFNLFPNMNVIENVMAAPMEILGKTRGEAYAEGMHLLKLVGLAKRAESYPDELSGGQQQRAAIARTLAMSPEIILFDEPTSALDPTMINEVNSVIRSLAANGMTMLIVTHDMNFARSVSNKVFFMSDGIIYEEGTPEQIFTDPVKEKTRAFIKGTHSFTRIISDSDFDFMEISTEIEKFGREMELSQKLIVHAQMVFEELCVATILPRFDGKKLHMEYNINCSDKDSSCEISIHYAGEPWDPFENDNRNENENEDKDKDTLQMKMVKNLVSSYKYTYAGGKDLTDSISKEPDAGSENDFDEACTNHISIRL